MIKSIQILAFVALSNGLFAQYMYVPQTISTPYGNVTTQRAVYMPMNYGNYGTVNPKFEFTITLKNDSVLTFKSRIETTDKKMYVLQKKKRVKRKIFSSETKEIYAYHASYGRLKGIVTDSCWYFKAHSGTINSYTVLPTIDKNAAIAMQQGDDGPIIPINKKNLEAITGTDDPKIVKWLSQYKYAKVIAYYNEQKKKQTNSK
jgi:hypothetical protein